MNPEGPGGAPFAEPPANPPIPVRRRRRWSFRMEAIDHGFLRRLDDRYRGRFTPAGRAVLWGSVGATTMLIGGLSTNLAYTFAAYAAVLAGAWASALRSPIRVAARRRLPPPASAGEVWAYDVTVVNLSPSTLTDLLVEERALPAELRPVEEPPVITRLEPGAEATVRLKLLCRRRGIYALGALQITSAAPSGLLKAGVRLPVVDRVTVFPAFKPLEQADIPVGRTHQPGGIPLASQVGESTELHGLRPWRDGDRTRDVNWSTYARTGHLVVREFQQEYFARLALVVDIAAPRAGDEVEVERAISLGAAITDALARQDFLINIFAAGNAVHRFPAGRAVEAMDHVLDLLAALDSGSTLDTGELLSALEPETPRLSGVFFVLTAWDDRRAALVRAVQQLGVAVRVICTNPRAMAVAGAELLGDELLVLP